MLNNDSFTYDALHHQYAHIINDMNNNKIDTYCKKDNTLLALSIFNYSIMHNDINTIKSLKNAGLDIHISNDRGYLLACKYGHLSLVQYFIDNGAQLHTAHSHNWGHEDFVVTGDALTLCVKHNHVEIADYLLQNKFDLSSNNNSALIVAVQEVKWDFVYKFIEHGADIHDFSILYHAVMNEQIDFIHYLIEQHIDISKEDDCALRLSAGVNNLEMVKLFLNHGANINAVPKNYTYEPQNDGENLTALATAANNGNWEIFQYLVAYGADINLDNDEALRFATCGANLQIIKFLVESGANIHAQDDWILKSHDLYFANNRRVLDYVSSLNNVEITPELRESFKDNYRPQDLELLEKYIFKHALNNSLPVNDYKIKKAKV